MDPKACGMVHVMAHVIPIVVPMTPTHVARIQRPKAKPRVHPERRELLD